MFHVHIEIDSEGSHEQKDALFSSTDRLIAYVASIIASGKPCTLVVETLFRQEKDSGSKEN